MNKSEFVAELAKKTGQTQAAVTEIVNAMPSTIAKAIKKGDKLSLFGFGTFEVQKRAARQGRNPATGESIKIKASKSPKFKAAKAFKDMV